jgi:protein-arginine kinase activator protein McsA
MKTSSVIMIAIASFALGCLVGKSNKVQETLSTLPIPKLQVKLDEAVEEENFEKAAVLRDLIKEKQSA